MKILDDQDQFNLSRPRGALLYNESLWLLTQKTPINESDLIEINKYGEIVQVIEIPDLAAGIRNLAQNEYSFFIYGIDFTNILESIRLTIVDKNTLTQKTFTYNNPSYDEIGSLRLAFFKNHIFVSYQAERLKQNLKTSRLKKIDLNGHEVWDKEINVAAVKTFNEFLIPSEDELLFISVLNTQFQRPTQVVSIDNNGNKLWDFQTQEGIVDNGSGSGTCYLNNGNLVTTVKLERGQDFDYTLNNWYDTPYQFIWLTPNGVFIRDTIYQSPKLAAQDVYALEPGNGNYFFSYGNWSDPLSNKKYSWIRKISNTGELIWDKKYSTPRFNGNELQSILYLKEDAENNIHAVGTILSFENIPVTFYLRLDKDGCLAEPNCQDIILNTNELSQKEESITVFPNPASNELNIQTSIPFFDLLQIYNLQGELIFQQENTSLKKIDISSLKSGLYYLKVNSGFVAEQLPFVKI